VIGTVSFREPPAESDDDLRPTMIWPFSVTLDNRARAAPIRYPGFENIGPNLSGCTNCRPDLTHSVGPRWTGGRPDYWDPWRWDDFLWQSFSFLITMEDRLVNAIVQNNIRTQR
jgi:hypothetical protein